MIVDFFKSILLLCHLIVLKSTLLLPPLILIIMIVILVIIAILYIFSQYFTIFIYLVFSPWGPTCQKTNYNDVWRKVASNRLHPIAPTCTPHMSDEHKLYCYSCRITGGKQAIRVSTMMSGGSQALIFCLLAPTCTLHISVQHNYF